MTYATLQLLKDRVGEQTLVDLTDRELPATGAIVDGVVDRALADAGATIDGYLAGRYKLPLEGEVPALLIDLALTIAFYKLHRFTPDQKIKDDYEGALRALRDLSTGTARLVGVAGVEPASSGSSGVQATDRERPLTPESLKGFI